MDIVSIAMKADALKKKYNTHSAKEIAKQLDIQILYEPFKSQMGAYKVILRNRFIFLKNDLDEMTENVIIAHELGHACLHRNMTQSQFKNFDIFRVQSNQMEYEANIFASEILIDTPEFLSLCHEGYTDRQIASITLGENYHGFSSQDEDICGETSADEQVFTQIVKIKANIVHELGYDIPIQETQRVIPF